MLEFLKNKKVSESVKTGGRLVLAPDQAGAPKGFVKFRHQYPDGSMSRTSIAIPGPELGERIVQLFGQHNDEEVMRKLLEDKEAVRRAEAHLRRRGYESEDRIMKGVGEGI